MVLDWIVGESQAAQTEHRHANGEHANITKRPAHPLGANQRLTYCEATKATNCSLTVL